MSEIQRYSPNNHSELRPDPAGQAVKYLDHLAALEERDQIAASDESSVSKHIERVEAEADGLREKIDNLTRSLPQDSPTIDDYSSWLSPRSGYTYTCKNVFWENDQLWIDLVHLSMRYEDRCLVPLPTLLREWRPCRG